VGKAVRLTEKRREKTDEKPADKAAAKQSKEALASAAS
jgi:hypothetical protein